MSIEAGLRTYLLSLASVTNLVGQNVFNGSAEESAVPPYVVCLRSNTAKYMAMSGDVGLTTAVVDAYCYGSTYAQAKNVADAIAQRVADGGVNGFHGLMGNEVVQGCFVGDEKDPDPILSAELAANKRYGTIVPLEISYESAGNE